MVCKECGSYNAENLSVCKVCGAKLREDDTGDATVESRNAQEDGLPSSDFVKARAAYARLFRCTGKDPDHSSTRAPSCSFRPTFGARCKQRRCGVLPACANPLPDAPFCPYCAKARIRSGSVPALRVPRGSALPADASRSAMADDDSTMRRRIRRRGREEYRPQKSAKRGGKIALRERARRSRRLRRQI